MRKELADLVKNTILFECKLPCSIRNIEKTVITDENDDCYKADDQESIIKIIYNAILEYSYSEFDIKDGDKLEMFSHAFGNKFKYNEDAKELAKQKLGIYGEVLLHIILNLIYSSHPLISKGYLYNPLEKSEAKGYDAYHLVEGDDEVNLWFGEAKFHVKYKSAIDSVFKNIEKALSDDYFNDNLISISNRSSDINLEKSKIKDILKALRIGNTKPLISEIKENKIKLVYPILIAFEKDTKGYDESIKNAVNYINSTYSDIEFKNISIDFSVFFIFLPMSNVSIIKKEVIKWIELEKPLI